MKMILIASILATSVTTASAGSGNFGEITRYITNAQAMRLSKSQIAIAKNFIHSNASSSRKRQFVRRLAR